MNTVEIIAFALYTAAAAAVSEQQPYSIPKFSIVLGGPVVWRKVDVLWSPILDDKTSSRRMDLARSLCQNLKDQMFKRSNVTAIPTNCEILWINNEDNNVISYMEFDQKLPLVLEDLYKIFLPSEKAENAYYETITHYQLGAEVTNSEEPSLPTAIVGESQLETQQQGPPLTAD